jgi:histone demethylase JARID1
MTLYRLKDSLKEMMERERMNRKKARALGLRDQLEEEDRPEDQYQCAICKVFCYLSQITCGCTNKIVCADHAAQLCSCAMDQHALRLRFSDAELEVTFNKVEERANQPLSWQRRLDAQLAGSARPHLRHLRSLVADGERVSHKIKELPNLIKFVTRASQWVEAANVFLIKPSAKPRSKRASDGGANGDAVDKPAKTLADLRTLLQEVDKLGFDAPEIAALKAIAATAEDVQERARELLEEDRQAPAFLKMCELILADASALNVRIAEIAEVEKIVGVREVVRQLEDEVEKNAMTLDQVSALLNRARVLGIPQDNQHVRTLQQRQRNGQSWDERASHVLAQPYKTIEELTEFVELDQGTLINPVTYESICRSLKRAREHDEQARRWLANLPGDERPAPSDVLKLVNSVEKEFSLPSIKEIKRLADFAADLESRCDQVLVNRYQHHDVDDIFDVMYKWVDYAKQHLPMFSLPRFNELDEQLTEHVRWLEHLPWRGTTATSIEYGRQVYSEVLKATRPEDELPPEDEFLTCICDDPVRPPQPGSMNEAVQCDHCFARFHGKCARSGGSCPFCDVHHWDGSILRHKDRPYDFCYMPGLLAHAPAITRHYSDDWRSLETVIHRIERLGSQVGQLLAYVAQERNHRRDYVSLVRHYMRKLYKIQFSVSPSPDSNYGLQLAKLHRDLASLPSNQRAKKRRRPKFTFGQDVDVDWHDNTRCICRGRTGYLLGYPAVRCEQCTKLYHSGCVFYPTERPPGQSYVEYVCPLCCLRKNRPYNYAELRVRDPSKFFC